MEEVKESIFSLSNGKTPGPDGLPVEFYKAYRYILAPQLLSLYETALMESTLPTTQNEALLVSLPKPGRDPEHLGSYRPLALLNTDYKIYASILAKRLAPLVKLLIHPDQNGFVPTRSTSLNIRRLFRVQQYALDRWPRSGCLVLDLEKVFDSLEWPYLAAILRKFDLGGQYLSMIQLLYQNPTVRVRTGRLISEALRVRRGTRQGCPLSPLLFSLAMEPLAELLRRGGEEWGIPLGDGTHAVSLYADDLLLYIRDLHAIPNTIENTLKEFEQLSGLRVNWSKSGIYAFNDQTVETNIMRGETLTWYHSTFRYLGIHIYRSPADNLDGNLSRAISAIRAQVRFWKTLPLGVMSRVALIKMIILQRLLYYFSNLPVYVPVKQFRELEGLFRDLIWNKGRPRMALWKMYAPTDQGGLAVPNMELYYLATQLQWLTKWLSGNGLADTATTQQPWTQTQIYTQFHPATQRP